MDLKQIDFFLKYNKTTKSILFLGDSGLGKSAYVKQFADRLGYELIILRLGELEPVDITGLPFKVTLKDGSSITEYTRPHWWPTHGKYVIVLDEVDRCSREMHAIAMQMVYDRRAGMRDLPDGGYVFALGNGDKYATVPLCQALMRRFAAINFNPTVDEWLEWAKKNKVHELIISFIEANKNSSNMLDTPSNLVGKPNIIAPTRSSWVDFSDWLTSALAENTDMLSIGVFAEPFVGNVVAASFEKWIKNKYKSIATDDLFDNKINSEEFKRLSSMQLAAISNKVAKEFLNKSLEQQTAVLHIYKNSGAEIFAALFSKLPRKAISVMRKIPDISKFVEENLMGLGK